MKVCVYGAGVIGGILASAIARAGNEVCLIARGPHLDAIKADGLTLVTPKTRLTTRMPASERPTDFGPQDLVIVATKTPAFRDVANGIGPLLGPHTLVVFAVNGVFWFYADGFSPNGLSLNLDRLDPDGLLHRVIGVDRAMGMVCWGGGEIRTPGVVLSHGPGGPFVTGTATKTHRARARDVIEALGVADVQLSAVDEVRQPMWKKFLGIAANFALCTLTDSTTKQMRSDPPVNELALRLMTEASAVASAHGFDDLDFDLGRRSANRAQHKPSMLQDFERRRPMEIDSTFGALQDLARQSGVATPLFDVLAPLLNLKAQIASTQVDPPLS